MTPERKYRLRYTVEVGEYKASDVDVGQASKEGKAIGLTDSAILFSILRDDHDDPHEGPKSTMVWSVDGRTKRELLDTEFFQAFTYLARVLADECPDLPSWQRDIAASAFNAVRTRLTSMRKQPEKGHF